MTRLNDCRSFERGQLAALLRKMRSGGAVSEAVPYGAKPSLMLTAWQLAALPPSSLEEIHKDSVVVVPDFLNYARLLNTGQALPMLRLPGSLVRSFTAGLRASPPLLANPLRAAGQDFWLVAEVLTRYDLALLPRQFRGFAIVHSYLADFAFAFEQRAFMSAFFSASARFRPGIQTQQLAAALSCLARWNLRPGLCSFLCSPADDETAATLRLARANPFYSACRFYGDTTNLPRGLQDREEIEAQAHVTIDGAVVQLV